MKAAIIQFLLFTLCVCAIRAQDVQFRPLTENETAEVKQKLESFEKGTATLESLTDNQEWSMKLMEFYVLHTNEVTTKMKLPISRSFAVWSKYPEAAVLARDYVDVYSNDWRGWRVLGGSKLMLKSYDEAVVALTNAARLGDGRNYIALGLAAVAINRLDILENTVIPHLIVQVSDAKQFSEDKRNQMRGILLFYAIKTDKKEIFIKAIAEGDISKIFKREELKDLIYRGCDHFEGPDIDKIRKELEAATESGSLSTATNSPPANY